MGTIVGRYDKDLVIFAIGDMDATDKPPKQGVFVLDGSGVTPKGFVILLQTKLLNSYRVAY